MRLSGCVLFLLMVLFETSCQAAGPAKISVHVDRPLNTVTTGMTGVCIEDVNHEIYGGLYSQMIFGESFQEPESSPPIKGFREFGGSWARQNGVLNAAGGQGPKLLSNHPAMANGETSVDVKFPANLSGLVGVAGLIVNVNEPAIGADRFIGYEISLDPRKQTVVLSRHRNNFEPLKDGPCKVPVDEWVKLATTFRDGTIEIRVNGEPVLTYEDKTHPLPAGAVGLRTWLKSAQFRNLVVTHDGASTPLEFAHEPASLRMASAGHGASSSAGPRRGRFEIERSNPFHGTQAQKLTLTSGDGELGLENKGLNRWGMNIVAGKPYEGYLWMRSERPTTVSIALENADGSQGLASATIKVTDPAWKRYDFSLTPTGSDTAGRFVVSLKEPGTVTLGHAFLQPGEWGRFEGLPVRRDVVEGLKSNGVTVIRLGGLMANNAGYRWKQMIGPRDQRQPYNGYWYPYSTHGWGIIDFLDLCERAGFVPVVDMCLDETPQDMADFVEYVNGSADTVWGKRRAADGHERPYRLEFIELGNEEAVDEAYWQKFKPLAEAIWAKDPAVTLIVGDFEYKKPISDPDHVEGAPRIKSLAAHKKILDLARSAGRDVWFDVHIWNHNPREGEAAIAVLKTLDEALQKLSPGANFRLCVLEENAVNHAQRRAVAHAETINGLMRMGDRVPMVCCANGLQPDRQNDNGWDQGLLFLSPSKVWPQPPCLVTQMFSMKSPVRRLELAIESVGAAADAVALAGEGGALSLRVVNRSDQPIRTEIEFPGSTEPFRTAQFLQLAGALDDVNPVSDPQRVTPSEGEMSLPASGPVVHTFAAWSVTRIDFKK